VKVNKIIFMASKLYHDITNKGAPYIISDDLFSSTLGEYYFLFEENPAKLNRLITGFDDNGIPVNSAYIDVENASQHYYPISIGQYALAVFNTYIQSKSEEKLKHFLRIADWFYSNKIDDERLGVFWLTEIPKPEYNISAPWKSAFTQSRAISVLLRAWQSTGEIKYLSAATSSLIPFKYDITDGGVSAFTKHGKFFEEYVASQPTMVLDGHLFSLLGLYDFYRAVNSDIDEQNNILAEDLFNQGVESVLKWLDEYDMGYWLRFNMCEMEHYPKVDPCTIGYLRLIIIQLKLLYKITGKNDFAKYVQKFSDYDKLLNIVRMYPVKFKALKKLKRI